jgi:hypothetical protein
VVINNGTSKIQTKEKELTPEKTSENKFIFGSPAIIAKNYFRPEALRRRLSPDLPFRMIK